MKLKQSYHPIMLFSWQNSAIKKNGEFQLVEFR